MENYTKYKLKERDELVSLLADKDNLFVIACNKCFKEFETIDEPDCGEFEKLAAEQGPMDAQYNIGRCYEYGNGVEQSYEEAAKWYQLAADNGHETAQNELRSLRENGLI